jgi:hypothetical protein
VQAIVGLGLWQIGGKVQGWLDAVSLSMMWGCTATDQQEEVDINFITMVFGSLILAAATQGVS